MVTLVEFSRSKLWLSKKNYLLENFFTSLKTVLIYLPVQSKESKKKLLLNLVFQAQMRDS